jgi:Lon-like protease
MTDHPTAPPPPPPSSAGSPPGPSPSPVPHSEASPDGDGSSRRRQRRHAAIAWVLSGLGVLLVVAIVAGFVVHLPYVIISPGSSTPLDRSVVAIDGAPTYPHRGNVEFLTVRVSTHDPNLWGLFTAWLDPDRDIEKRTDVVGCLSDNENQTFNTQLMQQSQSDAKYVALTRLGYTVQADAPQIKVVEVCRGVPAYGKLGVGDRVLAVDGHDVATLPELGPLVQQHRPGDEIAFTVDHEGETRTTTVTAGRVVGKGPSAKCVPARGSSAGTACAGIASQEFVNYQFPINVNINTERVGGPSAGLAFTLAIIDDLTPGSLTGGKRIAVTGAIEPNGRVDEVGGVEQKAITARTNGVSLMIVPKPEVKDARRGAGDVRVVGVDTIDEALAALHRAGGAEVPPTSTTAARS